MSETPQELSQDLVVDVAQPTESESTGDEAVDAVVSSLRGLDALPVSEHVAVFERAHESLRQVLSGAGEPARVAQASQG
jgi:hypothetical protein